MKNTSIFVLTLMLFLSIVVITNGQESQQEVVPALAGKTITIEDDGEEITYAFGC